MPQRSFDKVLSKVNRMCGTPPYKRMLEFCSSSCPPNTFQDDDRAMAKSLSRFILKEKFFDGIKLRAQHMDPEAGALFADWGRFLLTYGLEADLRKTIHNMSLQHTWLEPLRILVAELSKPTFCVLRIRSRRRWIFCEYVTH